MAPTQAPPPASISARLIHAALILGVVMFTAVAWYLGSRISLPVEAMPDRRVLYLGLFLVSAVLFGAAMYTAGRLSGPTAGLSEDQWWRANLGRAIVIWSLVDAPALLGTLAYLLTHDFRTLIATFTGLLLFVNYRPSRLAEP